MKNGGRMRRISGVDFPLVWVSYSRYRSSYEEDFADLLEHGVNGAELHHVPAEEWGKVLQAAEGLDIKFAFGITDITEHGETVVKHGLKPVPALMIGGAFEGRAVDRHLFSFGPGRHKIMIEEPIYDNVNCYKTVGRYYPDMGAPVKAEIVVPQSPYDGQQHLNILEGRLGPSQVEHFYTLEFELSGDEGDLGQVGLAVYWEYGGTDKYWIYGRGNVSAWASTTREALRLEVAEKVSKWKEANGGEFPHGRVVAARFGDECFHITGHLNGTDEISYPLWDYSEPSVAEFRKQRPQDEYPRTWGFPEIYGPGAYGDWMYVLHKGCAELCRILREAFRDNGTDVLVYRNITRYDIFAIGNYRDGTGIQLLSEELDIVHLDPYPCGGSNKYHERAIPTDMGYACGIARPLGKPVMPWLQAHSYWAELGGLDHPSPEAIERMVRQHLPFAPDALMWLAYPGTFGHNPAAWETAGRMHMEYMSHEKSADTVPALVIRHYSVWALLAQSGRNPMDRFITHGVIDWLQYRKGLTYNAMELRAPDDLELDQLRGYKAVFTSLPPDGSALLRILQQIKVAVVLCDEPGWLEQAREEAGVLRVEAADRRLRVALLPEAECLSRFEDGDPEVWRFRGVLLAVVRSGEKADPELLERLYETAAGEFGSTSSPKNTGDRGSH